MFDLAGFLLLSFLKQKSSTLQDPWKLVRKKATLTVIRNKK